MSDTAPKDQRALFYGAAPPAPRQPAASEVLFIFTCGETRYLCELREDACGCEATFLQNGEWFYSRRFDQSLDPTRPARQLAIVWATEARRALERGNASITDR